MRSPETNRNCSIQHGDLDRITFGLGDGGFEFVVSGVEVVDQCSLHRVLVMQA